MSTPPRDNVIPLTEFLKPLEIEVAKHHETQGSVYIKFNRRLSQDEFDFFAETCQRTAFLMRGLK